MFNTMQNAGLYLVNAVFDLYTMLLMVRFVLCLARVDYFNPVTQFIVKLTQGFILPIRRLIPTYANIEFSTLLVLFILDSIRFYLVSKIGFGGARNPLGIIILSMADMLRLFFNVFFWAIILNAILSWIQQSYSPVGRLLTQITMPIMRPIHRVIPPIGGIDISPIPALILLHLMIMVIADPLFQLGAGLTFG